MALKLEDRIEDFARRAREQTASLAATSTPALEALRQRGREAFAATALPGAKTESWKYSRIGPLLEAGLLDRSLEDASVPALPTMAGFKGARILMLDGWPQQLPETAEMPAGITVSRFSAATGARADLLARELGSLANLDGRPFVALNGALAEDGVLIHVASNVQGGELELLLAQSRDAVPHGAHPRVLVVLEAGASLSLVERHCGAAEVFTNAVIEVRVGAAARLAHMRLQLDAGAARSLTALDVAVARDGGYDLQQALVGSAFRRNEIRIRCTEPGAEVTVGGATLTRDRNHLDTQMCLEHEAPHCSSNQVFRALAGERSRTVLNGRIHIHPGAQKTAAELSSRNLLLSHAAEINVKPELEIYADDVKCAHGATIGRLDEQSLFYLRSRGVKEADARMMLSFAFLAGVVAAFPVAVVRDAVRPALEAAFMAPSGLST